MQFVQFAVKKGRGYGRTRSVNVFNSWKVVCVKPLGTRQQAGEQRQSKVRSAAGELFRTRGFDATSVRDIAAAAGVSVGTVALAGEVTGGRAISSRPTRHTRRFLLTGPTAGKGPPDEKDGSGDVTARHTPCLGADGRLGPDPLRQPSAVSRQPSAARAPCRAARDPVYERVKSHPARQVEDVR
jgi:hypothetical protein